MHNTMIKFQTNFREVLVGDILGIYISADIIFIKDPWMLEEK